jgi:hypothetical protein
MEAGRLREDEYRELQDIAIRRYLKDFIKSQLLSQTFIDNFDKARRQQIEEAVSKMFDEYVLKLEKDLQVSSRVEADKKLRSQGTSLDGLRKQFRRGLLADEYLQSMSKAMHISREAMEAYYQEHLNDYSSPEQVRWQLLEVGFRRHNDRKNARAVAEQAAADLRRGEDFATVVRKYSDGPGFEDGPDLLWTGLDNRADQELSAAMRELAAGDVKPVFDDRASIEFKLGPQQGPNNALNVMQEGAKRLRKRERSEKVVRKYYADGGTQPWTNPESVADLRVSAVLGQLAVGETSSVLECSDSFRIVRLLDRRPAGRKSFDEVEPSIRQKLEKQLQEQTVNDLYHRATIESPYFPEVKIQRANRASSGAMEMMPSGIYIYPDLDNRLDLPEKAPHRNCG